MEPERLRFDFTHGKPIDQNQIKEIEDWINSTALLSVQPVIKVRLQKLTYHWRTGTKKRLSD